MTFEIIKLKPIKNSNAILSCRDMMAVVFANSFTSFYGGIAIFSVLGFMAQQQGVDVSEVAKGGGYRI